ncbi:hypothetical protein SARC_01823 [Sphaeroforma arctica JP610]|uniref:DNA polymerase delta subunit 3 n=1 Tax=Sphaeroforma arctica JP610 TaxID=667725 RepID=A0A0L0GCQ6_9EUKA|nr:hypothetical protein SARC_01823 [Sphaeroforma arctica JP610]KNC86023.1 hypothetical protein SARC_01823 [Sphaeroforma arctica JP610]|eukprot:XP_014159925.1 hypothetical protein SARC_01823 [Sphaeroforma arctica JP610]
MGPVSFVHVLSVQPKEIKDLASMISIADSASCTIAERIENTKTKSQITCSTIKPRAGRKIEEPRVVKKDSTSSTLSTKPTTATATAQSSTATSKPTGLFSAKAKSSGKSAKQSWAQAQMAAAMSRKPEDKPEKKNTMSKSKSKALKNLEAATAAMAARKPAVKRKLKKEADSWIVADGEESDSESDSADEEEADRAAEGSDDDHDEEVQMSRKRPAVRRGVVEDSSDEEEEEEEEEVVEVKQQEKKTKHVPKASQDSTGQSQPEAEADNKVATEKSHSITEEEKNQAEDDVPDKAVKATMKPDDIIDLSSVVSQGVNAEDVDTAQLLEGLDDDTDLFMDDVGTNKPDRAKAKKNTVKKHQKRAAEKEEFVPAPKGIEVPPGKKVIKITKQQGKRMITENVIVDDEDYVPPKRQKFNSPKKPQAKSIAKGKKATKKGQASITSFFKKS